MKMYTKVYTDCKIIQVFKSMQKHAKVYKSILNYEKK